MFCKWCGKKIENIGRPCPSCGKNQDPLENGNGFWDLCSKELVDPPVDSGVIVDVSTGNPVKANPPKKSKTLRASTESKSVNKFWIGAWAATCILLVIAIILIGVGIGEIGQCMSEISVLRSSIYSVNTNVTECFAKLEEYLQNEQEIPENLPPEVTEPQDETEEDAKIDIEALLEDGNDILIEAEKLDIEIYEIETTPAKCVYIAVGELSTNENVKIFWQKSVDQGARWETISEDVSYIIVEANETDAYRIICVVTDDSETVNLYCAATIELDENKESQADDTESDTGSTTEDTIEAEDTDETQPTGGLDNGEDADLDTGNNDDTTATTDPEDGTVG